MRFGDLAREVLYTTVVALLLVVLWAMGYAKAINSQAARGWWPPGDAVVAHRALHGAETSGPEEDSATSSIDLDETD